MSQLPEQIHRRYTILFHVVVVVLALLTSRNLPSALRGQASIVNILLPLFFFWCMYFRHHFMDMRGVVLLRVSLAYIAASVLAVALCLFYARVFVGKPVISVGFVGSYTYSGSHQSLIFASAIVFYAYLTYAISVLVVSSAELLANYAVAGSPAYFAKYLPVASHAVDDQPVELADSLFWLHQRQGMIINVCLIAVFTLIYIGIIVLKA